MMHQLHNSVKAYNNLCLAYIVHAYIAPARLLSLGDLDCFHNCACAELNIHTSLSSLCHTNPFDSFGENLASRISALQLMCMFPCLVL